LILLRIRNISNKSCRENQNEIHTVCPGTFFENPAVYEITLTDCGAREATDDTMAARFMLG
jgi:hypothetical protein